MTRICSGILSFFIIASSYVAISQQLHFDKNKEIINDIESELDKPGNNFHTSIKPYNTSEINKFLNTDSLYKQTNSSSFIKRKLCSESLIQLGESNFKLTVDPLFNLTPYFGSSESDNSLETSYGLSINSNYKKRLFISVNVLYNNSSFIEYVSSFIDSNHVVPGQGFAHKAGLGYTYLNNPFYIAYSLPKYFTFEAGYGKNFWGDGYRSLLLSDNSFNYPYFKITTNIWKFKYVNLYTNLKDIRNTNGKWNDFENKYAAFHFLSINIGKRLNVGFFESIIWQGKDSIRNNGFDINYLNPIIFYRPVEFSLGSPNNALMGLNLKYKLGKKHIIYCQVLLDEFVMNELRNDFKHFLGSEDSSGSWKNKQAYQIGIKSYNLFGIKNLDLQTELNCIRPYTYSHRQILQNYAHYNQSLAHPLNSNLYESVSFLRYRYKKLFCEAELMYVVIGLDSTGTHVGQDIYQSTFESYIPENNNIKVSLYNNKIAQGVKTNLIYAQFKLSYLLNPKNNLRIEAGVTNRIQTSALIDKNALFVFFGVRTSLSNNYDF